MIESVHQLIDDVSLDEITPTELMGRSHNIIVEAGSLFHEGWGAENLTESDEVKGTFSAQQYSLTIARHESGAAFQISLRVCLANEAGEFVVNYVASYSLATLSTSPADEPIFLEFANKVAIMTLAPYVRHALADLTQRIQGRSILLPILRAGELQFIGGEGQARPN